MSLSKKEQEEVRTWLVSAVANMLGYPESTVVNAALNCVQKGMDRQSTCGRFVFFFCLVAHSPLETGKRKMG